MLTRSTRIAVLLVIALIAVSVLAGCGAQPQAPTPGTEVPTGPAAGGDAAGLKLAPGAYDQPDGTVQVIGTLEYRDPEGGVWLIGDGTKPADDPAYTLVVIANAADFLGELEPLKGQAVVAVGTRLEDNASIRMAGPEIELISISAATDGGPAE